MFHVKHDLKHDPAFEASDAFEYAPADAHDIRRARPEEQSEPGVDLATGRPVLATAGGRRVRGAVRAARHFATGQTMPEAVRLYPTAWVPIARRSHDGGSQQPVPTSGAWSRLAMGGVGRRTVDHEVDVWWAQSSPRSSLRSCRTKNPPTRPARVLAVRFHVKQRRATSDSTETAIRERLVSTKWLLKTWAGDGGCLSLNAVPHAVLGVALSDRRILWDP